MWDKEKDYDSFEEDQDFEPSDDGLDEFSDLDAEPFEDEENEEEEGDEDEFDDEDDDDL